MLYTRPKHTLLIIHIPIWLCADLVFTHVSVCVCVRVGGCVCADFPVMNRGIASAPHRMLTMFSVYFTSGVLFYITNMQCNFWPVQNTRLILVLLYILYIYCKLCFQARMYLKNILYSITRRCYLPSSPMYFRCTPTVILTFTRLYRKGFHGQRRRLYSYYIFSTGTCSLFARTDNTRRRQPVKCIPTTTPWTCIHHHQHIYISTDIAPRATLSEELSRAWGVFSNAHISFARAPSSSRSGGWEALSGVLCAYILVYVSLRVDQPNQAHTEFARALLMWGLRRRRTAQLLFSR